MRNKRGSVQDIALAMIFIFAGAVLFLVGKYTFDTFADKMQDVEAVNSSQVTVDALENQKTIAKKFDYILFGIVMGFTLAIIITGYLVGGHPLFSFIYFIVLVILVTVSSILSFVWEKLADNAILSSTADSLPLITLILNNFPVYIAIIGFIGMLIMFSKPAFVE